MKQTASWSEYIIHSGQASIYCLFGRICKKITINLYVTVIYQRKSNTASLKYIGRISVLTSTDYYNAQ